MPLYEYKCKCGNQFAELSSVAERDTSVCPKCGEAAKHAITPAHFDPRMGLDPAFATFSAKWARNREKAARQS